MQIAIRSGQVAFVDEEDADLADQNWHACKTRAADGSVYLVKHQFIHRTIMERVLGRTLRCDELVDHIDGDSLNNSRDNLRVVTHAQNMRGSRKQARPTSSRYKGVSYDKWNERWVASIRGTRLDSFVREEDAANAYNEAARELFGEFARLNVIEETG